MYTDISVDSIIEKLAIIGDISEVLDGYKNLTRLDIQSALSIALKIFTYKYRPQKLEILSEVSCYG